MILFILLLFVIIVISIAISVAMENKMKTVQMTLNDELIQQVDTIAKENNTSRSAFTREALTREALTRAVHHYKQLQLEKNNKKAI